VILTVPAANDSTGTQLPESWLFVTNIREKPVSLVDHGANRLSGIVRMAADPLKHSCMRGGMHPGVVLARAPAPATARLPQTNRCGATHALRSRCATMGCTGPRTIPMVIRPGYT